MVGSALIGQSFTQPRYFHGRRSAAGAGYDAAASGATNKGPTDRGLADTLIAGAVDRVVKEGAAQRGRSRPTWPPHRRPDSTRTSRRPTPSCRLPGSPGGRRTGAVRTLVRQHTEGRQFGFLGEPRVNVLLLNIALDSAFPRPLSK